MPRATLAETLRVGFFNVELFRKGPGLMLRDVLRGDPQAEAVARIIAQVAPDILLLQGVDYDADLHGARALRNVIAAAGVLYPHVFALPPNSGVATGLDMNGDGQIASASDSQGFGYFSGQAGMVILSRWPVQQQRVQNFSFMLWRDVPDATLPEVGGRPFPSQEAQAAQRLSTTGHWIVPIAVPDMPPVTLLAFGATPPVFDGPEDRNGLRNADEILLWRHVLDGKIGDAPGERFFVLGTANLDPIKGAGRHGAIRDLLAHPLLQDAAPLSEQGETDTVDWSEPTPGDMRVDYVLPSVDWTVQAAAVFWPNPESGNHKLLEKDGTPASRHRLVWVDVVARGAPES